MTSLLQKEIRKLSARYGGSLTVPLQRFGSWWRGQLLDTLPPAVRNAWFGDSCRLLVDVDGDRLVVSAEDTEGNRQLGSLSAEGDTALEFDLPRRVASVRLRLPADKALTTQLELPLAATENLREVVSFQIDRQTPFTPDAVYFDCAVIDRDTRKQKVSVALSLVPRKVVDHLLDALVKAGIEPDTLSVRGTGETRDGGLNLLPSSRRRSRGVSVRRHIIALAVVNVLLLAVAVTLPILQKQHRSNPGWRRRSKPPGMAPSCGARWSDSRPPASPCATRRTTGPTSCKSSTRLAVSCRPIPGYIELIMMATKSRCRANRPKHRH